MGSGGIQLRISDLLFAVQKRWKIIVTLTILGGVFGLLLSGMAYVQSSLTSYSISGSVAINTLRSDGKYLYGDDAPSQNDFHLAEDMVESVIYIMRSRRVLDEVVNQQELLGVTDQDIRNGLSINSYNATQILEMTLNWRNDEEGIAIWHSIIECANKTMAETLTMGNLAILNESVSTLVGAGGAGRTMPFLLAILGFAAGIGYAIMEMLMHPTLSNVKDIETVLGLEILGTIPRDNTFFKKKGSILVKEEAGASSVSQNYSAAAFILRNRLGTKEDHHCFYVTSATNQEGRSTVAANLAIQLSDMEHRTLLVDFDLKNPSLGALFMNNVDYEHSLNALYRGDINEQEAVTTLTGYLDILPAVLEHNTVMMDSMVMDLIRKLSDRYEYVILDAPPVGTESETLSLNQLADTVLFVIGYDQASIPEIQGALDKLDKSGIRVLGCIVNNVQGTRYRNVEEKKDLKRSTRNTQKKHNAEDIIQGADGQDEILISSSAKGKRKKEKMKSSDNNKIIDKEDSTDTEPENENAESQSKGPRNVIEELAQEESSSQRRNDQEILSELYNMGVGGEYKAPDRQ